MPSKSGAGFDKNPQNINKNGRPKKEESFTYYLWQVMGEDEVTFKGRKINGKEAVARKALELALKGDMTAIKYIADRLDGSPKQPVDFDANISGNIPAGFFQIELIEPCNSLEK